MKKLISLLFVFLLSLPIFAQDAGIEMADGFRQSGKIYVVVAVMAAIFVGIAIALFSLDRRLRKLERND
jgi:hypothetical protein